MILRKEKLSVLSYYSMCANFAKTFLMADANKEYATKADLARLRVPEDFTDPFILVFKMVSDNGANMKAAWNDGNRWVPCVDHTLELCTLPVTWVHKRLDGNTSIPAGSIAEAYAHGRGIVGYLHVSVNAAEDFRRCQRAAGLAQTKIDLDVKTRWRSAHNMGSQLVYNKPAILEMDKNPSYKDPGETWGKNKISMLMWDYLEEGTAILDDAAWASQFLEGDKYPTSSLVVPMIYALMANSSEQHDVRFANRIEDEFNDERLNPSKVPHHGLSEKIQTARKELHEQLVNRFDTDLPRDVKQFWFISALLDPRFKKLCFKHDNMLTDLARSRAIKWFTDEFNQNYRSKASQQLGLDTSAGGAASLAGEAVRRHLKRRKTSAAAFFAASSEDDEDDGSVGRVSTQEDELAEYLAVPQIKYKSEEDALQWWRENESSFPNVAVMARQFLGCPASSASVERLFSQVGIAFSDKRKSADASTLENIMFARANLP